LGSRRLVAAVVRGRLVQGNSQNLGQGRKHGVRSMTASSMSIQTNLPSETSDAGSCLRALGARSDVEKACNQKRPPQGRKVLLVRGASVDICFEHGRHSGSRYCQSAVKKARLVVGDLRVQKASGTANCTGCFGRETKTNRGEKP
jgi:hypothetical protein